MIKCAERETLIVNLGLLPRRAARVSRLGARQQQPRRPARSFQRREAVSALPADCVRIWRKPSAGLS